VESRHRAHGVVCDAAGTPRFVFGDAELVVCPRSALKPIQALPTVARGAAERFGLKDTHLAVMAASHQAEPFHLAAVGEILAHIGATEADLYCGPHPLGYGPSASALLREGREPTAIYSNCSGKHSGMLTLARLLDAPLAGYQLPDHPVQQTIQSVLAQLCGMDLGGLSWGTDGCGVPTYYMSLRALARGMAAIAGGALPAELAGGAHIASAMTRHPEYVGGTGTFATELMAATEGKLLAKSGAEGVFVAGIRDRGLGLAVKIEDGSARAVPPLVIAALRACQALPDAALERLDRFVQPAVTNTRAAVVGEIVARLPGSSRQV
jgi:L-asparaginase II